MTGKPHDEHREQILADVKAYGDVKYAEAAFLPGRDRRPRVWEGAARRGLRRHGRRLP